VEIAPLQGKLLQFKPGGNLLLCIECNDAGAEGLFQQIAKLCFQTFDIHGSVHRSTIHTEKSKKMQQCIKILLIHIYMKLNMFRVTHRPSSGA
jgi:hypothetical protein